MLAKGFGGAERLFVDFCLSFAEIGQQVQAVCLTGSKSAEMLSKHPSVQLNTISVAGTWDPFAPAKIGRLIKQHKSQIVQAHLARAALLAGKACIKQGLPLVVTTHNYIDIKYYKYVTMLVPPTGDQYVYYSNRGIEASRMKTIRHFSGIEPRKGPAISKSETIHVIAMGRLVHKKGMHILLQAFAILQENTRRKADLRIGGTGPEQRALESQIESLGLKDKVTLHGWADDVESFLRSGDVFVLPSLDEPFGLVVLEAMAIGLPIISSDTQGPREILDTDTAWLSRTGDAESLAAALKVACENDNERRRKSENALQRYEQMYSRQAVIPEFMNLFDTLLTAKTKPSPH